MALSGLTPSIGLPECLCKPQNDLQRQTAVAAAKGCQTSIRNAACARQFRADRRTSILEETIDRPGFAKD